MTNDAANNLNDVLQQDEAGLLQAWTDQMLSAPGFRSDRTSRGEVSDHARRFLGLLRSGIAAGEDDIRGQTWANARQMLEDFATVRAQQGFSSSETATFIFSLKQPLFQRLRTRITAADAIAAAILQANQVLDRLGLYTTEVFQRGREQVIVRQQQELMELSTPVVTLWDGVLALPIIGTLDSARTQVVMENLLQRIVESGASIAIIDITGVPTVDTLTAQHLLKTVAAARLMGADCIISGIRPQIAQTIVHLGVDLGNVVTKATLADAFAVALRRLGLAIVKGKTPAQPGRTGADEIDTRGTSAPDRNEI
jgi:rsbT co-antagonist protein RsbR